MTVVFDPQNPFRHTHEITGVILDNDGTLYREPDNAPEIHTRAAVLAVKSQPPLSFRSILEIEQLMAQSKTAYGGSLDIFEFEYRLDMARLRRDHYHNLVELTRDSGFFDDAEPPEMALYALRNAGIGLYIATHGNEEWTEYSLERNRLTHLFSAAHDDVIHKDDVPGHPGKNQSPAMYAALLDKIGVPPNHSNTRRGRHFAMVEDTVANLKYAKALGMMTILIDTKGIDHRKLPAYVDLVIRDRNDLGAAILLSNNPSAKLDQMLPAIGWVDANEPEHLRSDMS